MASARAWGADGSTRSATSAPSGPHPDRVFPILLDGRRPAHPGQLRGVALQRSRRLPLRLHRSRATTTSRRSPTTTRAAHTSPEWKRWMGTLPADAALGDRAAGGCSSSTARRGGSTSSSGSPRPRRRSWRSCSPDHDADVLVCTHTGLHWQRRAALGAARRQRAARSAGRPTTGGRNVWYALLTFGAGKSDIEFVPVAYDHEALAREMEAEGLPARVHRDDPAPAGGRPCLEILPAKERDGAVLTLRPSRRMPERARFPHLFASRVVIFRSRPSSPSRPEPGTTERPRKRLDRNE